MTEEDAIELQRAGSLARAAGRFSSDCPLYQSDQMPAATGEPVESWAKRVDHWRLGWHAEDALRS